MLPERMGDQSGNAARGEGGSSSGVHANVQCHQGEALSLWDHQTRSHLFMDGAEGGHKDPWCSQAAVIALEKRESSGRWACTAAQQDVWDRISKSSLDLQSREFVSGRMGCVWDSSVGLSAEQPLFHLSFCQRRWFWCKSGCLIAWGVGNV